MQEPRAFCRAVMHEYERQWSRAAGHAVRHPLRVKMGQLAVWCDESCTPEEFEERLQRAASSDDPREALLAEELWTLWRTVRAGEPLPLTE